VRWIPHPPSMTFPAPVGQALMRSQSVFPNNVLLFGADSPSFFPSIMPAVALVESSLAQTVPFR
jgi:hypothetical protein